MSGLQVGGLAGWHYTADAFLINTPPMRGYNVQFSTDAGVTTISLNGMPIAERTT